MDMNTLQATNDTHANQLEEIMTTLLVVVGNKKIYAARHMDINLSVSL